MIVNPQEIFFFNIHSIGQDKRASFLFLRLGRHIQAHFLLLSMSLCVPFTGHSVCVGVGVRFSLCEGPRLCPLYPGTLTIHILNSPCSCLILSSCLALWFSIHSLILTHGNFPYYPSYAGQDRILIILYQYF